MCYTILDHCNFLKTVQYIFFLSGTELYIRPSNNQIVSLLNRIYYSIVFQNYKRNSIHFTIQSKLKIRTKLAPAETPVTPVGVCQSLKSPVPSSPSPLSPQHSTPPPLRRAHVWKPPAARATTPKRYKG